MKITIHATPLPGGGKLRFRLPLVLHPEAYFEGGPTRSALFFVQRLDLGIDMWANTEEELHLMVHDQIAMLWREYAMAADSDLTADAQLLKRNLLAAIVEEKE